jgi:hypothetical protein
VSTLLHKSPITNEVPAAPVQAETSAKPFVPTLPALTANEVFAAPMQGRASTNLPASIANELPTPVQAAVGTRFILEEEALFHFPVSTANEVLAAPVQAGASTKFILKEAAAALQLPALTANEVLAASLQAGASTKVLVEEAAASSKIPALTADEVLAAPLQAVASTKFIVEEATASFKLLAKFHFRGGGYLIPTSRSNCR